MVVLLKEPAPKAVHSPVPGNGSNAIRLYVPSQVDWSAPACGITSL